MICVTTAVKRTARFLTMSNEQSSRPFVAVLEQEMFGTLGFKGLLVLDELRLLAH